MTDLKDLLENAAGDEPAITEDVLDADVGRGRRSVTRRRTATAITAVTATAAVAIGAWAVLPDSLPSGNGAGEPAAQATSASPTQPDSRPSGPVKKRTPPGTERPSLSNPPPMPWAATPVSLVRNDKPVPGTTVHCSLIPKGWVTEGKDSYLYVKDPKSTYPTHAPEPWDHTWGPGDGNTVTIGPFGDKVGTGWKAQVNAHVNGKEAAVFSDRVDGVMRPLEIFVRINSELTVQVGPGPRTGWDVATALRWAGSCNPVR